MDPHASEIVTQKVIEGISREETQAVWNPVGLVSGIIEIGFGSLPQVTDGFSALLIGPGPDSQSDAIESVRRILLKDIGVMNTVRLTSSCANLNIVRETSLWIH